MRNRFLGSIAGLAAGAGLALAQSPPSTSPSGGEPGIYSKMYPDLSAVASGSPESPVKAAEQPMPIASQPVAVRYVEIPATPAPARQAAPMDYVMQVQAQTAAPVASAAAAPTCCVDHLCAAQQMHGWVDAEYLLWRITNGPAPILASTGNAANLGVLGAGGIPVGVGQFDYGQISGVRFVSGGWLNNCQTIGMDGEAIYMTRNRDGFTVASDGNTVLARPFVDPNLPGNNVLLLAFPGALAGGMTAESATYLEGGDGNLVFRLIGNCNMTFDALLGFRYLDLQEDLKVISASRVQPGALAFFNSIPLTGPAELTTFDEFKARSHFYGGQLGGRAERCCGRWLFKATGKVGLGVMQETVRVAGATTLFSSLPAPMTVQGGLLAVVTNSTSDTRNQFAFVPELGLKLGYKVTDKLTATVGYNVLYASAVARPGDQVDTTLNTAFIPQSPNFGLAGQPLRPALGIRNATDFLAYGAAVGLTYEF